MRTLKNLMVVVVLGLGLNAFILPVQSDEWVVPEEYKAMKNPTDATDDENLEIGKELYMKHCKSCHGKEGLGDGPKAAELDTPAGDFSEESFQTQTDGELFYKTMFGRDDMPAYDKKISDEEEMWMVVTFMRTFAYN